MPCRLAVLSLDSEGFRSCYLQVIQGLVRGFSAENGDGGRTCVHPGVDLSRRSESNVSVPVAGRAWLKAGFR